MNAKDRMIIEEFRTRRADFVKLGDVVHGILQDLVKKAGVQILGIEHRVKKEESLAGKLIRKDHYQKLSDLTDLLGARVICYFNDEVDVIGKLIEEIFVIDREASSDKRALIREDSFGYLSLHYICSLPFGREWPNEICGIWFEIQIRTNLQHTWAQISHDRGYKSEFGLPRVAARQFARIASLLEMADEEFMRVRDCVAAYTEEIRQRIAEGRADDVALDAVSLGEFIRLNPDMQPFMQALADLCDAEYSMTDSESYVRLLGWLGKKTLGDMQTMLAENRGLALKMAENMLKGKGLDILSSTVGLKYLCWAELINKAYSRTEIVEFLQMSLESAQRAERQAAILLDGYAKIRSSEGTEEEKRYAAALELATRKHEGQFRIGGDAYITHPKAVAQIVRDWGYATSYQIAALFHDLLEDTDTTDAEILAIGDTHVLEAVKVLTKSEGYQMAEYVSAIKGNAIARIVKAADRLHNLRCALVADEEFKRKYILETIDWYMDLSPEIPPAVKRLAASMEHRLAELSFLYEPMENWLLKENET